VFIELAEYLRCPKPHEETFLVLSTGAMKDRHVLYGTLGCPVCHAEFPVMDGIARFSTRPQWPGTARPLPEAGEVQALLGLSGPGGYAMLLGSATGLADRLGQLLEGGVHLVCVNPPEPMGWDRNRSVVHATDYVPVRTGMLRGAVMGAETLGGPWIPEALRAVLKGQRVVALAEKMPSTAGLSTMAVGKGMWVGRKS
jgi:hypothetical protein